MKIFLCEAIHQNAYDELKKYGIIIDDFNQIQECEVLINRNLKMDKHFIDQCQSLKLVIIHGSGYDDIDVDYLKHQHIHLCHTPGYNALSVAELIVTMMLELSRKTHLLQNDYLDNQINTVAPIAYLGHEVSYKTFGMIGVGKIALKAAEILKNGFHMRIIGYSRSLTPQLAQEYGIEYCACLEDVLKEADYVSIGTSLNEDTYHIITKKELSYMKPSAYLINTARGAIVNQDDLYYALVNHQIAGAGLDVLENEPVESSHPLLQLPNVVYTPHMGASTDEALLRVGLAVVDAVKKIKNGEICEHLLF